MSSDELKKILSPLEYNVTQKCGTEPPFNNKYWNNKEAGIYIDVVSGEPLFSSLDKFDSGSGWPSFTKPLEKKNIQELLDHSHGMTRMEVKSKNAKSHLGHVFTDGPKEDGGLRYCINSASLKFIPVKDLDKEGLGQYKSLFQAAPIKKYQTAIFAAGCFWGVETLFKKLKGVIKTTVGYTGGQTLNPTYEDVTTGRTGHAEAILIEYDPAILSYEKLLDYFWRLHDPTTLNRQKNDVGTQYRSAIFYTTEEQKKIAEAEKSKLNHSKIFKDTVVTEIVKASEFYNAEEYHQDYHDKNPGGYMCHILRK